jgi:transcriptional antiterminator RfaH
MSKWYLIHSKPKQEYRAFEHLENQGFDVYLPQLKTFKLKKGRQEKAIEPLFPRYLFIQLHETSSAWYKIHSTRGVSGLVRFSEYPAEVPVGLINQLKMQANEEGILDKTGEIKTIFKAGDLVTITEGSFIGLEAIVKEQDGDQRVKILISMLGQQQSIKLPLSAVAPI